MQDVSFAVFEFGGSFNANFRIYSTDPKSRKRKYRERERVRKRENRQKIPQSKTNPTCVVLPFFKEIYICVQTLRVTEGGDVCRMLFASFRMLFPGHGEMLSRYPEMRAYPSNTGSGAILSTKSSLWCHS